jgi:hypothetical protein
MNNTVGSLPLVVKRPKIHLSLPSKIYAALFLLVLSCIIASLLFLFLIEKKTPSIINKREIPYKLQGTSPMKRLPLLIDRVVRDSSAYVYVKHASIRSELGIPWGKKIGLEK